MASQPAVSVRLTGVVLGCVVAAGCSAATTYAPPQQAVPPPGAEARRLSVPFDVYNFSPAEMTIIEDAEDVLIGDCMREQGMTWEPLPRVRQEDVEPPHRRRYGVIEPEMARLFGYHVPAEMPSVAARRARWDLRTEKLSPMERRAAYGDSPDGDEAGCKARASRTRLHAAPDVDASLFNRLIDQTFDASQRDEDVLRVFRSWSTCMKAAGITYADPLQAITDERWLRAATPSPEEIRVAVADVRCKEKTGLVPVWAEAEERLQNDVVRDHADQFRALKASKDRQLETARSILARTP
ncbi:hypothetical protein AB0K18_30465 [Nonomuraea sp. NPDC049421]|uniref:hypothetical protein n=1 Tax=Nonomuraea sp. NPDC049421 TaxID=3155275 RepID=UPI00343CC2FB